MRSPFNSPYTITQLFGVNPQDYQQYGLKGHEGIDLIPSGTDWTVNALADGVVVNDVDNPKSGAYGINVVIWHKALNLATQYCHLSSNIVSVGQQIMAKQPIGVMGATGHVTGPHLHLNLFQTNSDGMRLNTNNGFFGGTDPLYFLEQDYEHGNIPNMPDYLKQLFKDNNLDINNEGQIREYFGHANDYAHLTNDLQNANNQITNLVNEINKLNQENQGLESTNIQQAEMLKTKDTTINQLKIDLKVAQDAAASNQPIFKSALAKALFALAKKLG